MLVVDRLCLKTLGAIFSGRNDQIRVVFVTSRASGAFIKLLKWLGWDIDELEFNLGTIERRGKPRIFAGTFKNEVYLAEEMARRNFESSSLLRSLNALDDRNSVVLCLSKRSQHRIGYIDLVMKIPAAVHALGHEDCRLLLKQPTDFDEKTFRNIPELARCTYYRGWFPLTKLRCNWAWQTCRAFCKRLVLLVFAIYAGRQHDCERHDGVTVLSVEEDSFDDDQHLRQQFSWLTDRSKNIHALCLNVSNPFQLHKRMRRDGKATELPLHTMGYAVWEQRHSPEAKLCRHSLWKLIRRIMFTRSSMELVALLDAFDLIFKAQEIGALARSTKADIFLFKETHLYYVEGIQLLSKSIGIQTAALQYTNSALRGAIMSSGADAQLVFSSEYVKRYSSPFSPPVSVHVVGYLYDHMKEQNKPYASQIRARLSGLGATFVLGYFDERVDDDKFSYFDHQWWEGELNLLARMVMEHSWFAVVMKKQFLPMTSSQAYVKSPLLEAALKTGRFIELDSGKLASSNSVRNNVLPLQVGLCADLVVGELHGGTAILEAAVAGCPAAVLKAGSDYHEMITHFNSRVIVENLETLLEDIVMAKNDTQSLLDRFDWSDTLHHFVGQQADSADMHIQETLTKLAT